MEPKILGAPPEHRSWNRLFPKSAPGWLPDLISHAFGTLFRCFWSHFVLDFGAFNLQKMPNNCQIFFDAASDRLPQNFWGAAVHARGRLR